MKRILFFAGILFSLNAKAQGNLGISRFGPVVPNDTVMGGSSQSYDVWVKNYGPGIFNDMLYINTAVRDTSFTGLDSADYFSAGNFILNSGDSTLVTLTANYNVGPLSAYRYGIDVIVIWPYASSAATIDSLEFTIFIQDPNGVNELDVKELIRLYPNPFTDRVSVFNSEIKVESITIYDISGKLVASNTRQNTICTENLPGGMYQVEVILADKKAYRFKIVKQNNPSE